MKNKRATRKSFSHSNRDQVFWDEIRFPSSLKRAYYVTIFGLIILSVFSISIESEKLSSDVWSFATDIKVSSVTLLLISLFWLPILLPATFKRFPQLQSSLGWLREQGVEEVETNLLRIKLRYGVQEASEQYEKKVLNFKSDNPESISQETDQSNETRYREAISAINTQSSSITPDEALFRIDQLADYYDRLRQDMPSGSNRTRLMGNISSTMWALVPQTVRFPVRERLSSHKEGQRLSAYKHIEWHLSDEYIDLLFSRALGVLEVPFGQYAALLALRRVLTTTDLSKLQSRTMKDTLRWAAKLDYIRSDSGRYRLMMEVASFLDRTEDQNDTTGLEGR